ncbi:MAG: YfhO family protein [Pirellulaceae bacterium]|nr:YfhO family protein [Pirellulaceae bacterium]
MFTSATCLEPEGWRPRATRHIAAGLVLTVATLVIFWRLSLHPGDLLVGPQEGGRNDLTAQVLAFRSYQSQSLEHDGSLPVWNPYSLAGMPWLGNPQSAMFYPPNWMFYFASAPALLSWLMVLHHLFAGFGVYLLCRCYGFGGAASLLAGCCYLGAPYLVAHVGAGHYYQVCVVAWFPWVFLAFERCRRGLAGGVAGTAAALAMCFFCGHVQELFYLVLILWSLVLTDVMFGWRQIEASSSGQPSGAIRLRLLGRWLLVCLATIGLTAVELLPTWIYSRSSVRQGGLSADDITRFSLDWNSLQQLVAPFAFGGPEDYRGAGVHYWETVCYFGIMPLTLAIIGAFCRRKTYPVPRFVILGLLAMLFSLGGHAFLFPMMYHVVPGISLFRVPARALFLGSLFTAVLAGAGLDALVNSRLLGAIRPRAAGTVAFVALAACCWDLADHAGRVLRTIPADQIRSDSPLVQFLRQRIGDGRVSVRQELMSDREAWQSGIPKFQGYEPVALARIALYSQVMFGQENVAVHLGFQEPLLDKCHKPLVDAAGIRFAVAERRDAIPVEGWRVVQQGPLDREFTLREGRRQKLPYVVYENLTPLPRAFVLGRVVPVDATGDVLGQLRRLDPHRELLLLRDVLPPGERQELKAARIVSQSATRVQIEADLSAPGYLVLTDAHYPGWSAKVAGRPAEVLPANLAFRAVPLSRGTHVVEFTYVPPGANGGALILALTMMAMGYATVRRSWLRTSTG